MTRSIIDIHILQTVPPSNLNRDDTGSPKTAVFGGIRRSRVSSQAWKRATRTSFEHLLDESDLGVRTKWLVDLVENRIIELDPSLTEQAASYAEKIIGSTGIKLSKAKRKKNTGEESEHMESDYLVFLSRLQITKLAEKAIELSHEPDPEAAFKAFKGKSLLDRNHSVDVALFGRMVADNADLNVDACAQVAHAISVHKVDNEYDYFTAVDDEKQRAADMDAGAGMIGVVEFNSSTLYRYATVDVDRLNDNLGTGISTQRAVEAFIEAFATSMPTGKQNTFANGTLPDAIVVMVRDTQPVNLVGAFEDPVEAERGADGEPVARLHVAGRRLAERANDMAQTLGQQPVATWAVAIGQAKAGLSEAWGADDVQWLTLPELPGAVGAVVAGRLGESQ